jgi:hypothetical protein
LIGKDIFYIILEKVFFNINIYIYIAVKAMGHIHKGSNKITKISVGEKMLTGVRTVGEIAGALKTVYEVGKGIYSVGKVVAPIVAALI